MSVDFDYRPRTDAPVVVVGAGQSGLAAARALTELNVPVVVLEAGDRPAGSWPHYYDSLRLFSPAAFSSMPGRPFPGDPDRYPARDEVADYLERQAAALGVEIQTNTRVATVRQRRPRVRRGDGRRMGSSPPPESSPPADPSRTPTDPSSRARPASPAGSCTSPNTATRCRMRACV